MKKIKLGVLILIGVILIYGILASIFYFILHKRALTDRPLILIHEPYNEQQIFIGRGAIVHATARNDAGLRCIEFWVNDILVSSHEPADDEPENYMILSESWIPSQTGNYKLIVRAISNNGVSSQSSIEVEVVESNILPTKLLAVQTGDTLESIAKDNQTTIETIASLNDGSDISTLQPGNEIIVPSTDTGGPLEIVTDSGGDDSESPGGAAYPPGSLETLDIIWPGELMRFAVEPVQLVIEVDTLHTLSSYESLHCYVRLASSSPRWMPDMDGNPGTDESFSSENDEGTDWDVHSQLGGERALHLTWDGSQPVPIQLNCIGITGGGLVAVDLGEIIEEVEPLNWGITQSVTSQNGEDSFILTYRVTWPEKGPDSSIIPPWNVQINEERQLLTWQYLPDVDGAPAVTEFAILLNDTLQWTVRGNQHQTRIPEQWLNIPCGGEYRFTVIAAEAYYPDSLYSLPSEPAIVTGDEVGSEGCGRSLMVTFFEFTTGNVDISSEPVYGTFFANYYDLRFDGRPVADDNFPSVLTFNPNERYQVSNILNGFGSGQSQILLELPVGRSGGYPLAVGFELYQQGHKISEGMMFLDENQLAGEINDVVLTDTIGLDRNAFTLSFNVSTVGEAPVVSSGEEPPLPDLNVESLSVDQETGRLVINIRNTGSADWLNRDLRLNVISPNRTLTNTYNLRNITLHPGETMAISRGDINPQPPMGACVLLDPNNEVMEQYDRYVENGMIGPKAPYCAPQPDLIVSEVSFDPESEKLHISVKNQGEVTLSSSDEDGIVKQEDLLIRLSNFFGRSSYPPIEQTFEDVSIGVRETKVFSMDISPEQREVMTKGYRVTINPAGIISELDEDNNTFDVSGVVRLRIAWGGQFALFCPSNNYRINGRDVSGDNTWDMQLTATIMGGNSSRVVADWNTSLVEIDWVHFYGDTWCNDFVTDWFELAGDEELVVSRTAELDIQRRGFRWFSGGAESLSAANNYNGTTIVPYNLNYDCYLHMLPITSRVQGEVGNNYCGTIANCSVDMDPAGIRNLGVIQAFSDDITGDCWWSTTYRVFRQE